MTTFERDHDAVQAVRYITRRLPSWLQADLALELWDASGTKPVIVGVEEQKAALIADALREALARAGIGGETAKMIRKVFAKRLRAIPDAEKATPASSEGGQP